MSVSFPTKCFLFQIFIPLSSRNIQVFRKACAKFKYPQNNSASWDLQMGFNFAFKRLQSAKSSGSLRENLCPCIISLSVLRMRNVSDRFVQEFKTHILCSIILLSDKHTVYETRGEKYIVEADKPQMIV